MSENLVCTLEVLLDPLGLSAEQFKKETEALLQAHKSSIQLNVDSTSSGQLLLTLKGAPAIIDECHDLINKNLIERPQRTCVRLIDEAGDSIREQAYPILARIEQRFRAFTNRAITEVFGFDWWDALAPIELRIKVSQTRNRDKEDGPVLHPLEYTQFDDLVVLITAEVSKWEDSKPLTAAELLEILSGCNSINEAITRLQEKTKKVSYWDWVFAQYFQDKSQWDQIKQSLGFVIRQRRKVMHHRPIRLAIVQALGEHEAKLLQLFESAKTRLSEEERTEAQQDIKQEIMEQFAPSAEASGEMERYRKMMEQFPSPALEVYMKALGEEKRYQEMISQFTAPIMKAYEAMERRNQDILAQLSSPAAMKAIEAMQRSNQDMITQFSNPAVVKAIEAMQRSNQDMIIQPDQTILKDSAIPEARISSTRKNQSRRRGSAKKSRQVK